MAFTLRASVVEKRLWTKPYVIIPVVAAAAAENTCPIMPIASPVCGKCLAGNRLNSAVTKTTIPFVRIAERPGVCRIIITVQRAKTRTGANGGLKMPVDRI